MQGFRFKEISRNRNLFSSLDRLTRGTKRLGIASKHDYILATSKIAIPGSIGLDLISIFQLLKRILDVHC